MAALALNEPSLILESKDQAGRKLLVSGSGQCNFTHHLDVESFLKRCGRFARFLKPAIYALSPKDLMQSLASSGCPAVIREDGKVFPASFDAASVRDALLKAAMQKGHQIRYNSKVIKVEYDSGFILQTEAAQEYQTKSLLIATGGKSWPHTGSDGSGYTLAKSLGHRIIPVRAALASISLAAHPLKSCAGINLSKVAFSAKNSLGTHKALGSLLITHKGLSGPLILDNVHLLNPKDALLIDWLPETQINIKELLKQKAKTKLINALKFTSIPENLLAVLLDIAKLDAHKSCAELTKKDMSTLDTILRRFELKVGNIESLNTAMLSAGGVDLVEVKASDMSSKLVKGLHFAGEVLDYNLPSGGFNIQAACSTGFLAGLKM